MSTDGVDWAGEASAPRAPGVQSLDRAAAILRCFTARSATLSLSQIARETGLSTSTTHRLLASMQHNHLVRQTGDRRYALGPLLVQLVRSGAVASTLREAAMPVMTVLRDEQEETAGLHALLPSDERIVVDQVESHHPLRRTYTEMGIPIPLAYGAPGKVMLAHLPPDRLEAALDRPIRQLTPTTVTDHDALSAELEAVRQRGWATSFAERTPGIHTVAGPVFDHRGSVIGSLSMSGPGMRMPVERMQSLAPAVREAAWTVSEVLGATLDVVRARITGAWWGSSAGG
ncbi:MAG: IclR family transcriptional regulator [Actinomycetes bacterium]